MKIGVLVDNEANMKELAEYRSSGLSPAQVKECCAIVRSLEELYFKLLSTTTTNTIIFTEDNAPLPLL